MNQSCHERGDYLGKHVILTPISYLSSTVGFSGTQLGVHTDWSLHVDIELGTYCKLKACALAKGLKTIRSGQIRTSV